VTEIPSATPVNLTQEANALMAELLEQAQVVLMDATKKEVTE
jgi:hypothetical protein